jgi:GT2 family glycosyltransferase
MPKPLVHILIINWNGKEHLPACFDSLLESSYANARFVLVDNASDDDSVAFVRANYAHDPRVEFVVCDRNLGWSGGNNVGMKRALEAGADYIFLLNNDTATAPDAIERLVEMAERLPETGALAPKMLLFDEPTILNSLGMECSIIGSCWDRGLGRLDGPRWNEPVPVIGGCGGALFIRASVLEKTGLLPDFEIYLDDTDLCMAIWNAGYEIRACPEAVVRHKFSATMGAGKRARRKYYLNTRNRFRLLLRNYPLRFAPQVAASVVHGEAKAIGRALLNREPWKVWAHIRSWFAAVAYLPKALAERRRRRRAGIGACRFWHLIRQDLLFYPGTELPKDGWYEERTVRGEVLRPIAGRARIDTPGGRLRVVHANCYPEQGPTNVDLRMNGHTLATLSTLDIGETVVEAPPGRLDVVANRVFDAESTGGRADYGGWLRIEPLPAEPGATPRPVEAGKAQERADRSSSAYEQNHDL